MEKSEKSVHYSFIKLEQPHFGPIFAHFGHFWPKNFKKMFSPKYQLTEF